jgi:GNAT superfamily N-acetyltransferase
MRLLEVQSKQDWRLFHQVLKVIYHTDPHYIYPLRAEIEATFDPSKNKPAATGLYKVYVLLDSAGLPVGRIAAFIDPAQDQAPQKDRVGGIGFFECLDEPRFAALLFEKAFDFLRQHQIQIAEGPINFGERDRYWGLLVKGAAPPLYQENYQPAYYASLFQAAGFILFEQILTFKGKASDIPLKRLKAVAERLKSRYPVEVKPLDFKQIDEFADGFVSVYNASFQAFDHFKPIDADQIRQFIAQAKMIVDPKLACIAYYQGVPAGFIALYPDINPFLRHAKGKLNALTLPGFLWRNTFATTKNAKGMGFGIHPDYQSKGVFALLVDYLCTPRNLARYPHMYLAQIRTHNHQIRSMYAKLGVKVDRVHVTYRKPLVEGVEIEPFEFI